MQMCYINNSYLKQSYTLKIFICSYYAVGTISFLQKKLFLLISVVIDIFRRMALMLIHFFCSTFYLVSAGI